MNCGLTVSWIAAGFNACALVWSLTIIYRQNKGLKEIKRLAAIYFDLVEEHDIRLVELYPHSGKDHSNVPRI